MRRCELIDVATGKRYVRREWSGAAPNRSNVRRVTSWRPPRLMRSQHRGMRTVTVTASLGSVGPLIVVLGALGLFYVLHTYADYIDALLLAMVCLAAVFLGACTSGLNAHPPRRS
jgi:hypothetical protein